MGAAGAVVTALLGAGWYLAAQDRPIFRVKVDMVVLGFTVTDNKGRYVNGLNAKHFRILEDGIQQKLATFAECNKSPLNVREDGSTKPVLAKTGDERAN